jgi:hypothetical protein
MSPGGSEHAYYTITPRVKERAERILRATNSTQRTVRLSRWLESQKLSTQVIYSLLMLGLTSRRLSLDKYAAFYVCEIARSERETIVKTVLERHRHLKYLLKNKGLIKSSYNKKVHESEDCPPLVVREYRPRERVTKPADLAGAYEDKLCEIPGAWKNKYIEGRAFERDTYQFTPHLTMPTICVANILSTLAKDRNVLLEWGKPIRERTEEQLQKIARCYGLDRNYQLTINDAVLRSSIFAGLALFDFEDSEVHSLAIQEPQVRRLTKDSSAL